MHSMHTNLMQPPSKLVVPQAFTEYELRVYDKRKKVDRKSSDREQLR